MTIGMKLRDITAHLVPASPLPVERIQSMGQAGPGGAYSLYRICQFDTNGLPARPVQFIKFQTGSPDRCGINGTTIEALLAIALDRVECFQGGQFPCPENDEALEHIKAALEALHRRTVRRLVQTSEDAE